MVGRQSPYRQLVVFSSIIFLLPSMLVGGYLVGTWLDSYFGTNWIVIAGLFAGGIGAFVELFRILAKSSRNGRGVSQDRNT
jgi:hypothetical protein